MSQNEAFINKCKELRDCYYTGDGDIYVIKRMIALNHDTLTSVTPLHIPDTLTRIVFPQSNPFISSQWKKCKICRDIRCNKSEKKKHTGNHVEWIQHFNSVSITSIRSIYIFYYCNGYIYLEEGGGLGRKRKFV